jgi:hypothetical protein
MTTIIYECGNCQSHTEAVQLPPAVDGQGVLYPSIRCSFCGCACAPEDWFAENKDERGVPNWPAFYQRWSGCPNASVCSGYGQYAGDCEEGRLMQKCLVAVHINLEFLALHCLESAQPKPKRPARKKPDKGVLHK